MRWRERADEMGVNPDPLSIGMCGFSCAFLYRLLPKYVGGTWKIHGGIPLDESGAAIDAGGMQGCDGLWHGHYWLLLEDDTIVDLTADQFGHSRIVITGADDERYLSNYSESEIDEQVKTFWRASEWMQVWHQQNQPGTGFVMSS